MAYVSGPPRRRNFGQVRATSYTVEYTVFQRCLPSMAKPPGSCSLLTQEFAANGRRRHYCFESRRILFSVPLCLCGSISSGVPHMLADRHASQSDANVRPPPDRELVAIADYVTAEPSFSDEAYDTARYC